MRLIEIGARFVSEMARWERDLLQELTVVVQAIEEVLAQIDEEVLSQVYKEMLVQVVL
ncbi:MAG: hypothetical protein ACFFCO_11985 [Promethearchaeota archaeon]